MNIYLFLSLFICNGLNPAFAQPGKNPSPAGEEVPFPFEEVNRRVELADGEAYFLVGEIIWNQVQSMYYFQVDLLQHPWLANLKRMKDPTYPLLSGLHNWERFAKKRVRLYVKARGIVEEGEYLIALQGIRDHEPMEFNK